MKKKMGRRFLTFILTGAMFFSMVNVVGYADVGTTDMSGMTTFVFAGDSVTVKEGADTNYEVVVYDSTDTESEAVITTDENGNSVYSVPEGGTGQLYVAVKKKGGSYVFEGKGNGAIAVKKEATVDSVLYFNGLDLTSSFTAPVAVNKNSAASCIFHIVEGTTNTLTDNAHNNEENNVDNLTAEDAVMKFKAGSNVFFEGNGTLNINGNAKNGIKANNALTINGNISFNINALDNGISCENTLTINSGSFRVTTKEGDAIKSGADEEPVGDININGGTFVIDAYGDGIQATANLTITGGDFDITAYNGYDDPNYDGDDSFPSAKGLKASGSYEVTAEDGTTTEVDNTECFLTISGGTFKINSADDAIHSDKNVTITGGKLTLQSKDDAIHSEYVTTIGSETSTEESLQIEILNSLEGIEGATVNFYDGLYKIFSTDDCINAANSDLTGYTYEINIYDGNIYAASTTGDCIDSNKNITIYNGTLIALGAINPKEANAALDCDGTLTISGGTVLAIGKNEMAQTPRSGQNYVIWTAVGASTAVAAGGGGMNRPGGNRPGTSSTSLAIENNKQVTICDANGNELFSTVVTWLYEGTATANHVLYSDSNIASGSSYTIAIATPETPVESEMPDVSEAPVESEAPSDAPVPPSDMPVPPSDMPAPPSDMPVPPSDMPVPPSDGPIGFYYGDVDTDHVIGAEDALLILKHVVKLEMITDGLSLELADVDHDGEISANDALCTLQVCVKVKEAEIYENPFY